MFDKKNIRNFSIIAHIDHGKSTLADRILELTNTVDKRKMKDQFLDSMDLEIEHGITIKLNAVTIFYEANNNEKFVFNLIDTPGHVDFTYEVSRSLAACEGVLLVIDATRGIEAQTIANLYLAMENNLKIIIVINKIDLPNANIKKTKQDIKNYLNVTDDNIICVSAKTGENIKNVLEAIVHQIPAPSGNKNDKLRALIFDSYYDSYRGVVILIRVKDGCIKINDMIHFMLANKDYLVTEIGIRIPEEHKVNELCVGEVGYICAQIKNIKDVIIGETITLTNNRAVLPLPGYKKINPMVFCGLYPIDSNDYNNLKNALDKLKLNDASFTYELENSKALGYGFRCGFLGLLHMNIIKERLEREYNLNLILTAPNVVYQIYTKKNEIINIENPSKLTDIANVIKIKEPYVNANIFIPKEFIGTVMKLCQNKRGIYQDIIYLDNTRVLLKYEMPLSEIIFNFFDKLKSCTKGYANFDYEFSKYRENDLVKIDILFNKEIIDAFSIITYRSYAYNRGLLIIQKLKEIIPRQQFEIPIQVAIGNKIIARVDIKAIRKDVLAKCYGGDITRKKKLLEKQKEGKKKMKQIGSVEIPQEAFMSILSIENK